MDGAKYRWIGLIALVALLAPPMTAATATNKVRTRSAAEPHRALTGWIANWDGGASLRDVLAHASHFRFVSPYWYFTTDDPRRIGLNPPPTTARLQAAQTAALHAHGIKVVPTVGSSWDPAKAQAVFDDPELSAEHVHALVGLVTKHGYDGIGLNYEGFRWPPTVAQTARIRSGFNAFVANLCDDLHRVHKICVITVGPVTADGPWNVLDYRAIGQHADVVRLMCYGLHGPWGSPGPISTTAWTERVLRYAVARIPPSKIGLAVPTYGYQWPAPVRGDGSLTWRQAQHLIHQLHLHVHYSQTAGEPYLRWRSHGLLHTVWFENARSLAPKLALANRYHVGSVAFWILGGEDPRDWTVLRRLHIS
jgi:spore germination protein